ncbi:hypothetical protein [Paenibacillus taichungensis]
MKSPLYLINRKPASGKVNSIKNKKTDEIPNLLHLPQNLPLTVMKISFASLQNRNLMMIAFKQMAIIAAVIIRPSARKQLIINETNSPPVMANMAQQIPCVIRIRSLPFK